jgi:hypothetical protein
MTEKNKLCYITEITCLFLQVKQKLGNGIRETKADYKQLRLTFYAVSRNEQHRLNLKSY